MMLLALAGLISTVVAFNFAVNPLGAWHHRLVNNIYYRLRRGGAERVMTPYRLRTTYPDTLLVGTSRILFGMPIEQGYRDGFLNAALSAARPTEIKQEVHLALRNPRLKRIIWALDFFTFDKRLESNPDTSARLEGDLRLLVLDNLLSSTALDAGFQLVKRAISGRQSLSTAAQEPIPWPQDFICQSFQTQADTGLANLDEEGVVLQLVWEAPVYRGTTCCNDGMELFRSSVTEIKRAGIQLVLFLPPMTQYELEKIRQSDIWPRFQQFKRDLTASSSFWDFTGYNELAHTDSMFLDVVHMKPDVGMTIMRWLLGMPDSRCRDMQIVVDSALWVDSNNIDQVLALQDDRKRVATRNSNKYERVVARALARQQQKFDARTSISNGASAKSDVASQAAAIEPVTDK